MGDRVPRVVVAVPVHNGEATIGPTLRSLQEMRDVELRFVVRLNGCTDGTGEVARAQVKDDPRGAVFESTELISPPASFLRAFRAASPSADEYFTWLAAGDQLLPTALAEGAAALESVPNVGLAVFDVQVVDSDGRDRAVHSPGAQLGSGRPFLRLLSYATQRRWNEIYSLYRATAFPAIERIDDCFGFDVLLTWRLLLQGPAVHAGVPGMRYEVHRDRPRGVLAGLRDRIEWARSSAPLPWGGLWADLFRSAAEAPSSAVRRQARVALIIALAHPNWLRKFGERSLQRALNGLRKLSMLRS